MRYTDCGRGGPEKASTRLARTVRSTRLCTLACARLCAENIHGQRSCHREACAVFYPAGLRIALTRPGCPFGRLLGLEPAPAEERRQRCNSAHLNVITCSSSLASYIVAEPPSLVLRAASEGWIDGNRVDISMVVSLYRCLQVST